jgi:hypothetical protein
MKNSQPPPKRPSQRELVQASLAARPVASKREHEELDDQLRRRWPQIRH